MPVKLVLRWHTAVLGWLFVTMLGCALLFGVSAYDPALAADLAGQHRGGFIELGQSDAFNWIAACVAIGMFVAAVRTGWRWADGMAVRADEQGLAFHRSVSRGALKWSEIRTLAYTPLRLTGALVIHTSDGDMITLRQVDPHTGPTFARAVSEHWLALSPARPRL